MWSVILLLAATLLGTSGLRCPTQRILTDGGSLSSFPPLVSSATATSSHSVYPIEYLFEFSYPDGTYTCWCTDNTDTLPSITITLAAPVVLYGLLSGGYYYLGSMPVTRYVSNFTLEYLQTEGGNPSQYDPLGNLLMFSVSSMGSPALFQSPLLVTTLHLHVLDYESVGLSLDRVCWTLALMGCLQSDAIDKERPSPELPTSFAMSTMSVTPTKVSPSPTAPANQPCNSVANSEEKDSQAVVITVAIALFTIMIVAILMAAGVAVCLKIYRRSVAEYSSEQRERADATKEVRNTLFQICDTPGQQDIHQPDPQQLVDNPAYSSTRPLSDPPRPDGQVCEDVQQLNPLQLAKNPAYISTRPSRSTDEEMVPLHSQNSGTFYQEGEYSYTTDGEFHMIMNEGALP